MISHTTENFRTTFNLLPPSVKRQAKKVYKLFIQVPYHPSLHFKKVHPSKPIYSVRINQDYRAVGIRDGEEMIWFWIGSHANYEGVLNML